MLECIRVPYLRCKCIKGLHVFTTCALPVNKFVNNVYVKAFETFLEHCGMATMARGETNLQVSSSAI